MSTIKTGLNLALTAVATSFAASAGNVAMGLNPLTMPKITENVAEPQQLAQASNDVAKYQKAMRDAANGIANQLLAEKQQCGAAGAADNRFGITAQFYRQVAAEVLSNDTSTPQGQQKAANNAKAFQDWLGLSAEGHSFALAPKGALITFGAPQDLVVTDPRTGKDGSVMAIAQRTDNKVQMTVATVFKGGAIDVRATFKRASALAAQPNIKQLKNGQLIVARPYQGAFAPNVPSQNQGQVKNSGAWTQPINSNGTYFKALDCK